MLNKKYQTQSSTIATYDYADVEEGAGYVIYYATNYKNDTTLNYYLSRNVLYSHDLNVQAATTGTSPTFAKNIDVDFDITFNLPKDVLGLIRGNITIGGRTTSAAPNTWAAYAIIKFKKGDGTTIASTQTMTTTGGGGAVNVKESRIMNFAIDASSSKTHFKKGETLRITVEVWSHDNGGTNTGFGCDPKARVDTTAALGGIIEDTDSTVFEIHIPYVLDL